MTQIVKEDATHFRAQLGLGRLTMNCGQYRDIPENSFRESGWDVISGALIVIESRTYTRSASLWYASFDNAAQYRWVEVSYWSLQGAANQPCYLPPDSDADLAAAKIMHNWNLAHRLRPIDGDGLDDFCDRWMSFLAQAAKGTLARPSQLPEQ